MFPGIWTSVSSYDTLNSDLSTFCFDFVQSCCTSDPPLSRCNLRSPYQNETCVPLLTHLPEARGSPKRRLLSSPDRPERQRTGALQAYIPASPLCSILQSYHTVRGHPLVRTCPRQRAFVISPRLNKDLTMGGGVSLLPRPHHSVPFFSLMFRAPDRIKLALAEKPVVDMIRRAAREAWPNGFQYDGPVHDGSYEMKFRGMPFARAGGHDTAVASKKVALKILGALYEGGWELLLSSDLSRSTDLTTWFFQRVCPERPARHMFCLSLSSHDCLQMINGSDQLKRILKEAVLTSYGPGLQDERNYHEDYNLKLRGFPWQTQALEEGVWARKCILQIIRLFHLRQYRFYGTADLKGTADTMFFIYDETINTSDQFCMVSLNQNDRLRLIDCPMDCIDTARSAIENCWPGGLQEDGDLDGMAWEFKMKGYPWWADGAEAVSCRWFLTALFQMFLAKGWCVVRSLDISRRLNDKAVFVMKSSPAANLSHFCLSLNEIDKMRIINAQPGVVDMVRQAIQNTWPYGISKEVNYFNSHEIKLNGNPWSSYSGNEPLLARAMMCYILRAFCQSGWRVISSSDVSAKYHSSSNGPDYPLDVHSWFVAYTGVIPTNQFGEETEEDLDEVSQLGEEAEEGAVAGNSNTGRAPSPPPTYDQAVIGGIVGEKVTATEQRG